MPSPPQSPRPEVLAFLADIKEHPQEDGLRLIFADWLEENGDSLDQARAELIRSQIEFARASAHSPAWAEHGRRQRALQQKYTNTWLGPLAAWGTWLHRRGLVSGTLTAAHLLSRTLAALAGTEAWAWIEDVAILDAHDSDIARLGLCPLLQAINSLGFPRSGLGPAGAQALGGLRLLCRLDKLDLNGNDIGDRGFGALVASPYLDRLRILELCRAGLEEEGLTHLGRVAPPVRLERLALAGNRIADAGAVALARWNQFSHLQFLDLRGNQIGDAGARALSRWAPINLQELNLADNQIGSEGAKALAASPHLEGISSLVMWGNPIGPDGADALRRTFGMRVHVSGGRAVP